MCFLSKLPPPPLENTANAQLTFALVVFAILIPQTVTSLHCVKLPTVDLIFICCMEGHKTQPRSVIGGPVLRDRRRAEEQLNHLDIHQEVATQKATAAVSSPID